MSRPLLLLLIALAAAPAAQAGTECNICTTVVGDLVGKIESRGYVSTRRMASGTSHCSLVETNAPFIGSPFGSPSPTHARHTRAQPGGQCRTCTPACHTAPVFTRPLASLPLPASERLLTSSQRCLTLSPKTLYASSTPPLHQDAAGFLMPRPPPFARPWGWAPRTLPRTPVRPSSSAAAPKF